MKKTIASITLSLLFPLLLCSQGTAPEGSIWLGTLKLPAMELRLGVSLSLKDEGKLHAMITSIDQGMVEIHMDSATYEGDTLDIKSSQLKMHIRGLMDLEAGTWTTLFRQGMAVMPMIFHRVEALPGLTRPQEPFPPFPYLVEKVRYENSEDSITLGATLSLPKGEGPFPAVLLISGSGAQNRDSEIMGHKPFLVLADYLTRQGIAVLRYDDRGVGESTGNFGTATWQDFVSDALAGISYLAGRKEVNPDLIGIAGHSEGGTIAPLVVEASDEVDFMVMLAAAVMPWDQISLYQKKREWIKAGLDEKAITLLTQWHEGVNAILVTDLNKDEAEQRIIALYNSYSDEQLQSMYKTPENLEYELSILLSPWWRYACKTNVRPALRKTEIPVLAMNGELDTQVDASLNLPLIQEDLEAAPIDFFGVGSLPGLNHLFQTATTGELTEYAQIEETFAPEALQRIGDFILKLAE